MHCTRDREKWTILLYLVKTSIKGKLEILVGPDFKRSPKACIFLIMHEIYYCMHIIGNAIY